MNGSQADIDRLRDAVDHSRAAWHAARQDQDDAWRRCQEAVKAEVLAAEEYARAVAAYEAGRPWR